MSVAANAGQAGWVVTSRPVVTARIVEGVAAAPGLRQSTSDNCGATCEKDACISFTSDPVEL